MVTGSTRHPAARFGSGGSGRPASSAVRCCPRQSAVAVTVAVTSVGSLLLSLVAPQQIERSRHCATSADGPAALLAPLDRLLCEGGDERLAIPVSSERNVYGCCPRPRPEVIALSSCTATSISLRAYKHAREVQELLIGDLSTQGAFAAFEPTMEQMRRSLRAHLALEHSGVEVIFSPSGTDSQLHALFFAALSLGSPITSIVVGSDQTGSGTPLTARARHFSSRTARGKAVAKGTDIAGWRAPPNSIDIHFVTPDGTIRSTAEMDRLVTSAVSAEIGKGRKVVLQAMNASKFGWRAPSDACLAAISDAWPEAVQVVIDACQMRISRVQLGGYLSRRYLVTITGSKFMSGPPFSGALLVPKRLSDELAELTTTAPDGLFEYADRSDLPLSWHGLRNSLVLQPNFGQWLRWEAALEEMRAYYRLPASYRRGVIDALAAAIPKQIQASAHLEPYPSPCSLEPTADAAEEFGAPTIFPFLIRSADGYLDLSQAGELWRDLNRHLHELHRSPDDDAFALPVRPCHLGQPVTVRLRDGKAAAALRIAIGSRNLVECWSNRTNAIGTAVESILADVVTAIRRTDLAVSGRNPRDGRPFKHAA